MTDSLRRLGRHWQHGDAASILILLGLSAYLMHPFFAWNARALGIPGDAFGSWAWFYWLEESLFGFHQFPTWSPLWMNGIPFFGIVPPAGFFLVAPFSLVTSDIPAAYSLATIIMFALAGISMYLYLKHLSHNSLASLLGAIVYLVLPVHIGSMMFWAIFEIMCAYALVPLVLLFTDRFLDGNKQVNIVLLGLLLSLVLLSQIEYALIFLLFYACYLVFALAIRGIGLNSISSLLRRNKAGAFVCLLILLIPLSFYIVVLAEYGHFGGLSPMEVEAGLSYFTLEHFSDVFQVKAHHYTDVYSSQATDYYCGVLSFVILLASIGFTLLEGPRRRARLLFFLVTGFAFLILSMGIFGPFFPALRTIIPTLSGMRVPLRFYYIFAFCLASLFTLSSLSFARLLHEVSRVPLGVRRILKSGLPVLFIVVLMVDFSPYFGFYHNQMMDKEEYNSVSSFLQERISEDNLPADGIARVIIAPVGATPDPFSKLEQRKEGQFAIEIAQSWISWNQYKAAAVYHYSTLGRVILHEESLNFYSELLSYDYVMVYRLKTFPYSQDPVYISLVDQLVETLNSFCCDGSDTLLYRGSLDTQYHTVCLYKVNNSLPGKAQFYSIDTSVIMDDSDLYASSTLFDIYGEIRGQVTADAFTKSIVTIGGDQRLPDAVSSTMVSVESLYRYGGDAFLLPSNPLAVKVLEAEDFDSKGWVTIDREGQWGVPTSGVTMAVPDSSKEIDNYLKKSFLIENEGDWILNISYLAYIDTGKMQIYVDGQRIDTIDTRGSSLAIRTYATELFLSQGWHELKIVGRSAGHTATGTKASWVEVDVTVLLNKEELPEVVAQSQALWARIITACTSDDTANQISNFSLSPRGISLDVDAAHHGILSVAYYANPWWRVYVDGKETQVLKVNGIFAGCYVEEGQHQVQFIYNYPSPFNLFSLLPR